MIDFLGRDAELRSLAHAINAWGQRQFIDILGQGGIGKTRLLQELRAQQRDAERVYMLEIIDFDLPAYDFTQLLGRALARAFPVAFEPYVRALRLRQQAERGLISTSSLPPQALDLDQIFVDCCNHAARERRLVLRFDTVEKARGRHSFSMLVRTLLRVENVAVIMAGRPVGEHDQGVAAIAAPYADAHTELRTIVLPRFDRAFSLEYIRRKQAAAGLDLDPEWQETLAVLADGRPVLIDLAVELGKRFTAANWLRSLKADYRRITQLRESANPAERAEFAEILQRFDRELVDDLTHMRNKLVELTLLLARVAPLDIESAAYILEIDARRATQLFAEAAQRASFKVIDQHLLVLHDVVRDLINEHVYPVIDGDGDRARNYLTRAIAALDQQSQAQLATIEPFLASGSVPEAGLDDLFVHIRAYQQSRLRIAEYTFRLDPIQGVEQLAAELQILHRYGTLLGDLSSLFDVIREYLPDLERRSIDQYVNAHMLLADQYMRNEQYQLARQIYDTIEPQIQSATLERRYEIARQRGSIEMGIGNAIQALDHFRESADLARALNDPSRQANALISCAWAARSYGTLYQPERYYHQALKIIRSAPIEPTEAQRLQAIALNGLSYVYAIDKRPEARELLDQAIRIRRGLGLRGRAALAQSYATAGEVYCELGDPKTALTHLELAEEIIKDLDSSKSRHDQPADPGQGGLGNNQWFGKIYSAQGRAYSALAEQSPDQDTRQHYFAQARKILDQAKEQAIAVDLPRVYQRLGFVYASTPAGRAEATRVWAEGFERARASADIFNEFNIAGNLAHMAIYGHYSEQLPDDQAFDTWFEQFAKRVGSAEGMPFPVLLARFNTYRGCLALKRSAPELAGTYLNDGLTRLFEREHDMSYSFRWQLSLIEQDVLPQCQPGVVRRVMQKLLEDWMEHDRGVTVWERFESWAN